MHKINSFRIFVLIIFLVLFWLLFSYKLTDVPPGINGDEAAIGLGASTIAKTGYDQNNKFLPLFVLSPGGGDWKQPVTIYSTALIFKLFGTSYFALRSVSILLVLVSAIIIFLLIREAVNTKTAIIGILIYVTSPIIMIQSHLALENIALLPFVSLWLLVLFKYHKYKKKIYLVISAIALGISFYSYLGMRLVFPVFTILSMGFIIISNIKLGYKKVLKELVIFLLALIPFILLMFYVRANYPGALFANNRPREFTSYQEFLYPFVSSFDLSFLFLKGDSTPYHSTGKHGMFLLAALPLFLIGIYQAIKSKSLLLVFALITFFASPILFGLPGSIYRASRLMMIIPAFSLLSAYGFYLLLSSRKILNKFLIFLLLSLIGLNYVDFLREYWFEYPKSVKAEFARPTHRAFDRAFKVSEKTQYNVYLQKGIYQQNPLAGAFFKEIYKYQDWDRLSELPEKGVIITVKDNLKKEQLDKLKVIETVDEFFTVYLNE